MRPASRRAFLFLKLVGLVILGMLILFFAGLVWAGARNDAALKSQLSASGLRVEQAFPRDAWFFADFSTLADGQRIYFETLLAKLTQDPQAFRAEFLRGIDENLKSVDLSYVEDIAPMLGEGGFRFALGMSGGDAPVTHAAITVKDPLKAADFLSRLERQGRFLKKTAGSGATGGEQVLYFNAAAFNANDQDIYYFTLFRDLLLAANDEKEVLEMVDLLKTATSVVAEEATATAGQASESLWTQPEYQEVIDELPVERVAFLYVNNELLNGLRERQGAAKNLTHYLKAQGLAFVATAAGLDFRGVALGDRAALDADETTLDELRAHKTYLHKFMPSENLAVYLESYGFANMVERQLGVSEQKLAFLEELGVGDLSSSNTLQQLFGKGYSVALHQNEVFLPGLTVMVDVTDGRGLAGVLKESLDKKVSDLVSLLKFQGGALGESVSRESVMIRGGDFTAIRLNVKAFMEVYGQAGPFVLPDNVSGEDIWLSYGITKEGQFIVSTYDGWLEELAEEGKSVPLSKDEVYEMTREALGGFKEGVVYVRFESLLALLNTFQGFREALRRDAATVYEEADTEGFQDVRVEAVDWAELLAPLQSFAFSSEAEKYRVRLGGSVLIP